MNEFCEIFLLWEGVLAPSPWGCNSFKGFGNKSEAIDDDRRDDEFVAIEDERVENSKCEMELFLDPCVLKSKGEPYEGDKLPGCCPEKVLVRFG